MKKLLSAVFCLILILSCSTAAIAVEKNTFTFSPDTVEAAPGDIIEFTVSIEAQDKCRTLGLIPQYDAAVFEIVDGKPSVDNALVATYSPDRGFVFLFATATKLDGEVLTLRLKVRDAAPAGTYEIGFKVSMKDKEDPIETEVENAKITVIRSGSNPAPKPTDPPKTTEKPTEPPKETEKPKATNPAKETEAAQVTDPTGPAADPQPTVTEPEETGAAHTQSATEAPTEPAVTTPEVPREFEFPKWAIPVYAIGFGLIIIILILKRILRK